MNIDNTQPLAEYDEISPITKELTVLVETDPDTGLTSKLCMHSGYSTNETLISGSDAHADFISHIPKLLQNLCVIDDSNHVWFPITIYTQYGILFPDGTNEQDWVWRIAPIISIEEADREKYPVLDKPGEFYEQRLAIEQSIWYQNDQFNEAFAKYYDLIKASNN
jgi:hypothetical protein